MSVSKLEQLIEQQNKLQQQIEEATQKRIDEIGSIIEKHGLHRWSNASLNNLCKQAVKDGEAHYKKSSKQTSLSKPDNIPQQVTDNQNTEAYQS